MGNLLTVCYFVILIIRRPMQKIILNLHVLVDPEALIGLMTSSVAIWWFELLLSNERSQLIGIRLFEEQSEDGKPDWITQLDRHERVLNVRRQKQQDIRSFFEPYS